MTEAEFQEAWRILTVLEMTEFNWTILDVLAQPEAILDRVMLLRDTGNRIRIQRQAK